MQTKMFIPNKRGILHQNYTIGEISVKKARLHI